jgi:hypothetical protein
MRLPAGRTVSQALEAQHIKLAELAATEVGILQRYKPPSPSHTPEPEPMRLSASIRRYLDQIDTLKKPNTYRKYDAVLTRFDKQFPGRELQQISIEELNEFVIKLRRAASRRTRFCTTSSSSLNSAGVTAARISRASCSFPRPSTFFPRSTRKNNSHVSWSHAIPGSGLYFRRSCLRDSGNRK